VNLSELIKFDEIDTRNLDSYVWSEYGFIFQCPIKTGIWRPK